MEQHSPPVSRVMGCPYNFSIQRSLTLKAFNYPAVLYPLQFLAEQGQYVKSDRVAQ
jgi:hypothetical protein